MLVLLASLFPLISRANDPVVSVGTQTGTMRAGVGGESVTYTISVENIPGVTPYTATLTSLSEANIPGGPLPEGVSFNVNFTTGNSGTLTLTGDDTTSPGTTTLSLGINGVASAGFNLVISNTYTVTYNGNENTGGTAPQDSNTPYAQGAAVTVLGAGNLIKTDHDFVGWNTQAGGNGTSYAEGDSFNITANTTLHAQWEPISTGTFKVTYNRNEATEGTVPVDNNLYDTGDTVTLLGNTGNLRRPPYVFSGWNTRADGTGDRYNVTYTMGTDNVIFYAQWDQILGSTLTFTNFPAPTTNGPVTRTLTGDGYTGTIEWRNAQSGAIFEGPNFISGTQYRAVVTLTTTTGHRWPSSAPFITVQNSQQIEQPTGFIEGNSIRFTVNFQTILNDDFSLSAPQITEATASNRQIILTWTPPTSGSGNIIRYWISVNPTAGYTENWQQIPNSDKDTTTHIINALANGALLENETSYTFQIRAQSSTGLGIRSATQQRTPTSSVPEPPRDFTATAGNGQVALTWNAPPPGSFSILRFQVWSSHNSTWLDLEPGVLSHTFTGLNPTTNYTFRVRALTTAGAGAHAQITATPTGTGKTVTVGTQNGTLAAGAAGATVTFPVTTTGITAGAYTATVANLPAGVTVQGQVTITVSNNQGTGTLTLLGSASTTLGTRNNLTLTIDNTVSAAFTLEIGTATAPSAPQSFTVTPGNGQVTLTWSAPSNSGSPITSYQVSYWATSGYTQNWTTIQGSGAGTTSHIITGLTNGTNYTFEIRAVNSIGPGTTSGTRTSTPSGSGGGGGGGGGDGYLDFDVGDGGGGGGPAYESGGSDRSRPPNAYVQGNTVRIGTSGDYLEYDPTGRLQGIWEWDTILSEWKFLPPPLGEGPGAGAGTGTGTGTGAGDNTNRPNPQTRDIAFIIAFILPALLIAFFILSKAKKSIETRRSR